MALSDILVCRECKHSIKFEESGLQGLGFKLVVVCKCGRHYINSGPNVNTGYEINRRIVLVLRLLGLGLQSINLFCNFMDIGSGMSKKTYENIVGHLYTASQKVFFRVREKSVAEEKEQNIQHEKPLLNLKVSGDGTWKKRGFSSKYGVITPIDYYTGKLIDLMVKSSEGKSCTLWEKKKDTPEYEAWLQNHAEDCSKNHDGSAGKMEVVGILEMFSRSVQLLVVRYEYYIGDGDTSTFKSILNENPYGEELKVKKRECIGHVSKRMGTRLRQVKKKEKIGGKGKLTDALIKKLSTYYGLAIRRNSENKLEMKKSIMATYVHLISTNEKPQHSKRPTGKDIWCTYQKDLADGKDMSLYEHKPSLHADVQKHILPIYKDLSKDDLLERCLGAHTQNTNECFNMTVWKMCPNI